MSTAAVQVTLFVGSVAIGLVTIAAADPFKTLARLPYLIRYVSLIAIIAAFFVVAATGQPSTSGPSIFFIVVFLTVFAISIYVASLWSVYRTQDIGWSKWLCLLFWIPIVHLIYLLLLFFIPSGGGKKKDFDEISDIVKIDEGDPPIRINPQSISHAFIALTHKDVDRSSGIIDEVANLNRACQPRLWSIPFKAKFITFAAYADDQGYPNPVSIPVVLKEYGLPPSSSIVINDAVVSFDNGSTQSRILVGFAFRDHKSRIYFPCHDACIPN